MKQSDNFDLRKFIIEGSLLKKNLNEDESNFEIGDKIKEANKKK